MKRFCTILVMLLVSSSMVFAQTRLHVSAGVNISEINEGYEDKTIDAEAGLQFGVSLRLGDRLYVEPGVYYFQLNNQVQIFETDDLDIVIDERESKISGLKVPVLVGFDLLSSERHALRVFGGPNATYLTTVNEDIFGNEEVEFERVNWGMNLGIGADLGRITVNFRREWGMSDAFTDDFDDTRNNVYYFSAGLLF